jgi:hypothetical protein
VASSQTRASPSAGKDTEPRTPRTATLGNGTSSLVPKTPKEGNPASGPEGSRSSPSSSNTLPSTLYSPSTERLFVFLASGFHTRFYGLHRHTKGISNSFGEGSAPAGSLSHRLLSRRRRHEPSAPNETPRRDDHFILKDDEEQQIPKGPSGDNTQHLCRFTHRTTVRGGTGRKPRRLHAGHNPPPARPTATAHELRHALVSASR